MSCLALTVEGRQWTANLYSNVFEMEHQLRVMGRNEAVGIRQRQ